MKFKILEAVKPYNIKIVQGRPYDIHLGNNIRNIIVKIIQSQPYHVQIGGGGGGNIDTADLPIANGYLNNGKFIVSVADGQITISLKTLDDEDPSPENPIGARIEGVQAEITQAVSRTFTDVTGWFNSGNADNQDQPLDYFVYLVWATGYETPRFEIVVARIPYAVTFADFSTGPGNDDSVRHGGHSGDTIPNQTDIVGIIGRFTATMSSDASGADWSSPTDIINRPIYETKIMKWNLVITLGFSTLPTGISAEYRFVGRVCETWVRFNTVGVSNANTFRFNFPISSAAVTAGGNRRSNAIGVIDNNNYESSGYLSLASGSRACQVWRNNSATGWTTSGNKSLLGFHFAYPI